MGSVTWSDPRIALVDTPKSNDGPVAVESASEPAQGNPFSAPAVSMQTSGAPVPVLPVIPPKPAESAETKPTEAPAAPSTDDKPAESEEPPPAYTLTEGEKAYAPPAKGPIKQGESELQENGLPRGWVAVLDPPSGRFFFVDETKEKPEPTWVCLLGCAGVVYESLTFGCFEKDDPRTPEIESAPEEEPKVYAPPPKKVAAPVATVAVAAAVAAVGVRVRIFEVYSF